jgi:hypothetical protein
MDLLPVWGRRCIGAACARVSTPAAIEGQKLSTGRSTTGLECRPDTLAPAVQPIFLALCQRMSLYRDAPTHLGMHRKRTPPNCIRAKRPEGYSFLGI